MTRTQTHLKTAEVADILHVSSKTVSRWATEGRLPFLWTMGGHRRYPEAEIRELAASLVGQPAASTSFNPPRDEDECDV